MGGTLGFETEKVFFFVFYEDLQRYQIILIFPFTPIRCHKAYPDKGFCFNYLFLCQNKSR